MLQNIREKTQSWFATLIIGLICLSFALWGIHNYITGNDTHEAAIVNGNPVTLKEVDQQYQRLKQQQLEALDEKSTSLPLDLDVQLKMKALDATISQHVLHDSAHKQGFFIGSTQLQKILTTIPAFQVNGSFNEQRFREVLNDVNYTPQAFIQDVQKALMLEQVRKGFINSAFVMPEDGARAVRLIEQRRDIRYATISPARFQHTVKVTQPELEAYFRKHPQQFTLPEKVKIAYITLNLDDIKRKIHVQPTEVKEYYQQNIAMFTRPKRWHLAHIQIVIPAKATKAEQSAAMQKIQIINKDLKNGIEFAKVARKYSDDVISARMSGELGWFNEDNFDASTKKAALSLKKVGDISQPVKTANGVAIYKLLEVENQHVEPFNAVAEEIAHNLINEKAEKQFYDDREVLSNTAFSNPHSLNTAASMLALPIQSSDWLSQSANHDSNQLLDKPEILNAAFSTDVLLSKNNSQVLEISPEQVIVLRVIAHQKPTIKPFHEVAPSIHKILVEEKAKQEAVTLGQKALAALTAGESLTKIAQNYALHFIAKDDIKRTETVLDPKFIEEVFKVAHPNQNKSSFHGVTLPSGDYILLELIKIKNGDLSNASPQQKHFVTNQLEAGFGQLDYTFYVQSSIKSADIEIKNNAPVRNGEDLNV